MTIPVALVGGPRDGEEVELEREQVKHGRLVYFARLPRDPEFVRDTTRLDPTTPLEVDTYRLELPHLSARPHGARPVARYQEAP